MVTRNTDLCWIMMRLFGLLKIEYDRNVSLRVSTLRIVKFCNSWNRKLLRDDYKNKF